MFLLNTYCHERLFELRQEQLVQKARRHGLLRQSEEHPVKRIGALFSNVRKAHDISGRAEGRNPGRSISTPEV